MLCQKPVAHGVDVNERTVKERFRGLLRLHFHEWEYNGHFGGDDIEALLQRGNPLIDHQNANGAEEVALCVFEDGYESDEIGISLHGGYSDNMHPHLLVGIASETRSLTCFIDWCRKRLRQDNPFEVVSAIGQRVSALKSRITVEASDLELYRARIGYKYRNRAIVSQTQADSMMGNEVFQPYADADMAAPPPNLAGPGRLNRPSISFLYAATKRDTAICEVRPHPGDRVSICRFRQSATILKVASFANLQIDNFCCSDSDLDDFEFLYELRRELMTPVSPASTGDFTLTQAISDALREANFDGIAFPSSVSEGVNYCFFNPKHFQNIDGSAELVRVEAVNYKYEDVEFAFADLRDIDVFWPYDSE